METNRTPPAAVPVLRPRRSCALRPLLMGLVALLLPAMAARPAPLPLRVHCTGSGTPVYLVGGGPAFTSWHLEPVQRMLAQDRRACRWDMRGVGDNAALRLPAGEDLLPVWLADMAEVLPPRPVVLWGHSWGALQALLFARRYPGRVAGVVLSNPVDPALESLEHIERRRYVHDIPGAYPTLEDMGTPRERLLALRRKLASYFPDGRRGWQYARRFEAADADGALNVRAWQEYRRDPLNEADMRRLAPLVTGVIYCRGDVLMPENRRAYHRLAPAAARVVLEDCGHFPWVEHPARYGAALRTLVARAAGAGHRHDGPRGEPAGDAPAGQ